MTADCKLMSTIGNWMNLSFDRRKKEQVTLAPATFTATSITSERSGGCIFFKVALHEAHTTLEETMSYLVCYLRPDLYLVYENGPKPHLKRKNLRKKINVSVSKSLCV